MERRCAGQEQMQMQVEVFCGEERQAQVESARCSRCVAAVVFGEFARCVLEGCKKFPCSTGPRISRANFVRKDAGTPGRPSHIPHRRRPESVVNNRYTALIAQVQFLLVIVCSLLYCPDSKTLVQFRAQRLSLIHEKY